MHTKTAPDRTTARPSLAREKCSWPITTRQYRSPEVILGLLSCRLRRLRAAREFRENKLVLCQMSSSFLLYKRRQEKDIWTIPGPEEAHYVRAFGECHPEYTALPIGNPDGVKICIRSAPEIPESPGPDPEITKSRYYKFASRLYEPANPEPVQMRNPTAYDDRFGPNRGFYLSEDYYRPAVKYDGIGGYPKPTAAPTASSRRRSCRE